MAIAGLLVAVVQLLGALQASNIVTYNAISGPDRADVGITLIFTIVEIATLTLWIIFFLAGNMIASFSVLAAGLFLEHLISRFKG